MLAFVSSLCVGKWCTRTVLASSVTIGSKNSEPSSGFNVICGLSRSNRKETLPRRGKGTVQRITGFEEGLDRRENEGRVIQDGIKRNTTINVLMSRQGSIGPVGGGGL